MTLYILVYFSALVVSFCYAKAKDGYACILFKILLFLLLFCPLAFRYDIGTDYSSYANILKTALQHDYMPGFEIGWYPIIYLIRLLHLDIHFFFVIPAFLSVLVILYVIPRKYVWICIPVYLCFSWINSFNIVRQAFASIIFLLSINAYLLGNKKIMVFWGIVSFLFHTSLILLCIILFVMPFVKKHIPKTYTSAIAFIIFISILAIGNVGTRFFNIVVSYTPYSGYLNSIFAQKAKLGSGVGVLLKECILLLFILANKNRKKGADRRNYALNWIFPMTMGAAIILASQVRILGRIANLFDSIYIFLVFTLAQSSSKYRKIFIIFIFLASSLLFFKTLVDNPSSLKSGLGITPYQSIFSR